MLIIEGCDNIGKTTLSKRLVEMANERLAGTYEQKIGPRYYEQREIEYRHMTRPPNDFDYFYGYQPYTTAINSMYVVQDRFHLGTIAYDDPPQYTRDQLRIIESWIYKHGSMIIILVPNNLLNYETRLHTDSKKEMFDISRMVRAATVYEDISNEEFKNTHEFGLNPTIDFVINHYIGQDGKFRPYMVDEHLFVSEDISKEQYNGLLNAILDQWFQRIAWARKVI